MISRRDMFRGLSGALSSPLLLSRADAQITPDIIRYAAEMEPLVALFEQTPRDKCPELLGDQLRRGVPYRQLMAAVFLAGIRNVNPQPPGFALHCVFIIHSAHLLSLEAPPDARLLPLFYALDNFKAAQDRDAKQKTGDYTMRAMIGPIPVANHAASEFTAAMDIWDQERAERAVVALARSRSASENFEMLRRYGARDYRNIGHKAIYVANANRTLDVIGWQYAEPVLRSLVLSLADFGKDQEVNGYRFADQCYLGNLKRVKEAFPRLSPSWGTGTADAESTKAMLAAWRGSAPEDACADTVSRMVKNKIPAGAVWDAVHLAAAELAMRVHGPSTIVGIHGVTSANALHHAYATSTVPETRLLLLLQAVGWIGQFRKFAETREQGLRKLEITALEPSSEADRDPAEIFADVPAQVDRAASRVLRIARDPRARQSFLTASLRMTVTKAEEVHYYKYLAALIEDIGHVNAEWQPHLAATVVYYARGANDPDSATMKRAREVLKSLPA
jgi:hypothetical protein